MTMNKLTIVASAILMGAASGLLAPNNVAAGQAAPIQTAAAGEKSSAPDPAQIGRGAAAWAGVCGNCHNLRDPQEYSDKNWDVIVDHMRVVVPLPGQTAQDIKAFLKSSN